MMRKLLLLFVLSIGFVANAARINLLPTPRQVTEGDGAFVIPASVTVGVADSSFITAVEYLGSWFPATVNPVFGAEGDIVIGAAGTDGVQGGYELTVTAGGINVKGVDYEGIVNGLSTLRQLLPVKGKEIMAVTVSDSPSYGWRGFMLDCARHFFTVDEIEQVLDLMALYKLNTFHWHLADDDGWRAEIKRYPQLIEKGAFNRLSRNDRRCLSRAVSEDNPDFMLPADRLKITEKGDTLYGGYYTQEEMRHIVDFAARRGITVVPEIDFPGHSVALTHIMPEVSCSGHGDRSICVGKDLTLEVCRNIFDEIFDIFPSRYVHIGGDEVERGQWAKCPDCQRRVAEKDLAGTDALQGWFIRQMELHFRNHGRTMIGWDEIAYDGIGSETAIMWWRGDNWRVLSKATADGKRVVCTSTSCLYLDYDYTDSYIPKILDIDPRNQGLEPAQQRLVNGLQGNLWSERVPTLRRAHYQMFPRLFAIAESGWADPDRKLAPATFWTAVEPQFERLDRMGVAYQIPEILGVDGNNVYVDKVMFNPYTCLPSATLRYTTDGTIPTSKSRKFTKPFAVDKDCTITVASFRPDGTRSSFKRAEFRKTDYRDATEFAPSADGLLVEWHENPTIDCCTQIDTCRLLTILVTDRIVLPVEVDKNRALIFKGYMYAPVDGIYSFKLNSDDGSYWVLDDEKIIDNDGFHGARLMQSQQALRHGWHPVEIRYFDYRDWGGLLDGSVTCVSDSDVPVRFAH